MTRRDVIALAGLSASEILVYLWHATTDAPTGRSMSSQQWIADMLDLHRVTVADAEAVLVREGLIEVSPSRSWVRVAKRLQDVKAC